MIYITQIVYLIPGQESTFHEFEEIAIPIISRYNGRLLVRIRPDDQSIVSSLIDNPYEIHLVEFDSEESFEQFTKDEERKKYLHLKDQSIKAVMLFKGIKI